VPLAAASAPDSQRLAAGDFSLTFKQSQCECKLLRALIVGLAVLQTLDSALAKPVPPRRDYFLRLKPPATNAMIVMTIATAATNISNSKIPMLNIVLVPLSMDAELAATSVALRDT
jgi:hypothetical protein